jgi:WD40 repeat protein
MYFLEGLKILNCSVDCSIRIFPRDQTTAQHILEGHTQPVSCLFHTSEMLFSGSQEGQIRIWDIIGVKKSKPQVIRVLSGHQGGIKCIDSFQHIVYSGNIFALNSGDV